MRGELTSVFSFDNKRVNREIFSFWTATQKAVS